MKIVVTGAAGAIGSHLAERLLKEGHEVIGIDAFRPYYNPEIKKDTAKQLESQGIKIYDVDLAKSDNYHSLLKDSDVVFHLAAQPGISATTPFQAYLDDNIIATQNLLQECRKNRNLKAFIHGSTSSVYGAHAIGDETAEPRATSYYGVTKLAAEQLAIAEYSKHGLPVIVLRFFSVYGPRERPEKLYHKLIKSIDEDTEFPLYEGSENHIRSYTYVSDIIEGCLLVLNNLPKGIGEIFNLGTDKTMTTAEGIKLIEKIMGKKAKLKIIPKRSADQLETHANIDKMKKYFGYEPRVKLEEGLKAEVDWYMKSIHGKF